MERVRSLTFFYSRHETPAGDRKPDAATIANRPPLAPAANRSMHRIDELDAQLAWEGHIAAGRIQVR